MSAKTQISGNALAKRRRLAEGAATFGLILICAAMLSPFASPANLTIMAVAKWIYAAGALIYVIARVVDVNDPEDSSRIRRLRRMEFWAGVAFMMAAAFWFYEEIHLGPYAGVLAVMRNTVMFTLAGAMIQIIASWMIVWRTRKESGSKGERGKQ